VMTKRIGPAYIIASGSLSPGFPATEIDREVSWRACRAPA
jgi:hypothetical protein